MTAARPGFGSGWVPLVEGGSAIRVSELVRIRVSDARIQLISGHESKKSLEVYQHLSLDTVEDARQEAVQSLGL